MSYPQDGVVSFSITDGMPLTGVYNYEPNPNGPVITPKNGYFDISRAPKSASNQWTMFNIKVPKPVATGCILQFNVSYTTVQPATEVKLTLASDVILRYDGTAFNYVYWANDSFHQLGKSAITVDGKPHQVNLFLWPAGLVIFEDGIFIAKWMKTVAASVEPIFNWQILNAGSSLKAALSSILIIPSTFAPTVQTPWDLTLTSKWSLPDDIWTPGKPNSALPVTYAPEYMRVATDKLTTSNSWVYPSVVMPLVLPVGIVTYRMRVNASGGSESKITIIGDNILRITDNGHTVLWTLYIPNGPFETLAPSSIKVGSGQFTDVTVIYSAKSISLFEDGVFKYTRTYPNLQQWNAPWWVQHLDVNTAISADIEYIRCLPLAMDHPPVGAFNVYNFKYNDRVMDLAGSLTDGPVIGFNLNAPPTNNQQWVLTKLVGNTDKNAFVFRNAVSNDCFAAADTAFAGAPIFGSTKSELFDIKPVPDLGVWSVTVNGASFLSLQLFSGEPRTQIILFSNQENPNDGQKWQLVRALNAVPV